MARLSGERGDEVDVGSWLDAYRRAWEDADAEAAAALFNDRATYRSNIFQEPYEGPDGVRRYWHEVTASQSQVSVRMGRPFVDGNRVAAEFWTTMLVDGAETTLPGCLLLEFGDDGRCRSLRESLRRLRSYGEHCSLSVSKHKGGAHRGWSSRSVGIGTNQRRSGR